MTVAIRSCKKPHYFTKRVYHNRICEIFFNRAAGVMLLCCCSRTYPFFRAPDDITALAEITCIFGTDAIVEVACQYGKRLITSEKRPEQNLSQLCSRLARRGSADSSEVPDTPGLKDVLLPGLLRLLATERLTAKQALALPLFTDVSDHSTMTSEDFPL